MLTGEYITDGQVLEEAEAANRQFQAIEDAAERLANNAAGGSEHRGGAGEIMESFIYAFDISEEVEKFKAMTGEVPSSDFLTERAADRVNRKQNTARGLGKLFRNRAKASN